MKHSLSEEFSQLLSLSHDLLKQEFSLDERLFCDHSLYQEMVEWAISNPQRKAQPTPAIVPSQSTTSYAPPSPPSQRQNPPHKKLQNSSTTAITEKKKTTSQQKKEKRKEPPKTFLELHPLKRAERDPLEDIRAQYRQLFPNISLLETLPDDEAAKKVNKKTGEDATNLQVLLLYNEEKVEEVELLTNLTKAITDHILPAKLLKASNFEKEEQWEYLFSHNALQLVITSEKTLSDYPTLQKLHKQKKENSLHRLGSTPLILLEKLSLYIENPLLKRELWNNLLNFIPK